MSTRRETLDLLRQALDSAGIVSTPVIVADQEVIEAQELPAITVAWVSDAIDDDGSTAADGSSLQTRVLEVAVSNLGTNEAAVEDAADAIEDVVFRTFAWADFSSADKSASTPEEGDRTVYSIGTTFRIQYEKKIER